MLQDRFGQIREAYSISAGLDYLGVGPEHAYLKERGLVKYENILDCEAFEAFKILSQLERIIPELESAHAVEYVLKTTTNVDKDKIIDDLPGRM